MAGKWHMMEQEDVLDLLCSDGVSGLSEREAKVRLERFGPNGFNRLGRIPWGQLLIQQIVSIKTTLLLLTGILVLLWGDLQGSGAIFALLLIWLTGSVGLACWLERVRRQGNKQVVPEVRVIREGKERKIAVSLLVPGDLVVLEQGDMVPADLRLLWTNNLWVEESMLGQGKGIVEKTEAPLDMNTCQPEQEMSNMVLMGTVVLAGKARGMVVATGMHTEAGMKAGLHGMPRNFRALPGTRSKHASLFIFTLVAGLAGASLGLYQGMSMPLAMAVGTGLAALGAPGGFSPLTGLLYLWGFYRMRRRNVTMRCLSALEPLGQLSVACLNQTGTLTSREAHVRAALVGDTLVQVQGEGYDPKGTFQYSGKRNPLELSLFLKTAVLCNHAQLRRGEISISGLFRAGRQWNIAGDTVDGALLVMAARGGVWRETIKGEEQIGEIPFTPYRKMMSVLYKNQEGHCFLYAKGAPEVILQKCSYIWKHHEKHRLDTKEREKLEQQIQQWTAASYRVLALAGRALPQAEPKPAIALEQELVLYGLVALEAPLEQSMVGVMHGLRRAGLKVLVLTGEHPVTARSIAAAAGFWGGAEQVLTGPQMERLADGALREKLASCGIVARINPRQKQRIIRVLQESGEVVSYTGKGAGDVLPLQAADVGVVTKTCPTPALRHASSLVVSGFSAFLSAMEEVKELFSQRESMGLYQWCGSGLLALLVISGLLLGLGLPLLPLQMIWLGLVGIGLQVPNFAACSWREVLPQGKRSLDRGSALWKRFQSLALVLGAGVGVTLLAFWWTAEDSMVARTAAFNTMAMVQLFTGFYVITQGKRQDMGQGPLVTSPAGFVSFLAFPLAQLAITIVPFLQVMFHTTALAWGEWILVLVLGCAPFLFLWGIQWIKATVMHKIMYLRV